MKNRTRDENTGRYLKTATLWTPEHWDNGYVNNKGRFMIYRPDCPRAYESGYCLRSHVVWWLHYGVAHNKSDDIHHVNGNKLDDRIENLELKSHSQHSTDHARERSTTEFKNCEHCGKLFKIDKWRKKDRVTRFCGQKCYHAHPRTTEHKKKISKGLKNSERYTVNKL